MEMSEIHDHRRYSNHRCRCDECRASWRDYMRTYHQRRYLARAGKGQCYRCDQPAEPHRRQCAAHLKEAEAYRRSKGVKPRPRKSPPKLSRYRAGFRDGCVAAQAAVRAAYETYGQQTTPEMQADGANVMSADYLTGAEWMADMADAAIEFVKPYEPPKLDVIVRGAKGATSDLDAPSASESL